MKTSLLIPFLLSLSPYPKFIFIKINEFLSFRTTGIKTSNATRRKVSHRFFKTDNFSYLFDSMQKKSTSMNSLSTDMVSRIEYDEKEQECMAKDEQLQVNLCSIETIDDLFFVDFTSKNSSFGTFTSFERYSS